MRLVIVGHHIFSEYEEFFTGLFTLLISVSLSFIAGIYLGSMNEVFLLIPGLMVLATPSINMRGAIAGILTSRLSSSMHLGAFEVRFSRETDLGDNLRASILLTVIISVLLAIFGKIICVITGTDVIGLVDMVIISVVSGMFAGLIVTMIGVVTSIVCYRHSWNLDMVGAPVVTTFGDMMTLPFLVITALLMMRAPNELKLVLGIVVLVMIVWAVVLMTQVTVTMWDVLREGVPLLVPLSLLGIIAGVLYTDGLENLMAAAAVLILMAPFMNGCGSIGGILTSRVATEMHMGLVDANFVPSRIVLWHFVENYTYAFLILPLMGFVSHYAAVAIGITTPGLLPMMLLSLIAGVLVITVMNFLGYYTAVFSYRMGYDPDNFGVPVVTSSIDLVGATALLLMMMVLF
ncbi:MAG: magnesium transporter [Methanocalculaceae archaeon]|nr:magnesium transporter [Methanocalculaceae archaeon]